MYQVEYKGVVYRSLKGLACALGVNYALLRARFINGWSLDKAITTPVRRSSPPTPCKDHLGNEHANISAMAKAWGMGAEVLRARLSTGWGLEAALTVQPEDVRKCKDHIGKVHKSFTAMAKAWGLNLHTLNARLENGWSLERALTTAPLLRGTCKGKPCKDHIGKVHKSFTAMAKAWGLNLRTIRNRLKADWSLERALTTPARRYRKS